MAEEAGAGSTRLKAYKFKGMDQAELRRRRDDEAVQLRKQRRDEQVRNYALESRGCILFKVFINSTDSNHVIFF